jgi:hypothetical protein
MAQLWAQEQLTCGARILREHKPETNAVRSCGESGWEESDDEGFAAAAALLHVGVLEAKTRPREVVRPVHAGPVEVEITAAIDQQFGAFMLEDLVTALYRVEANFILQARAPTADNSNA